MKKLILLPIVALALSACELPDIAGLNSMPDKTGQMSDKMDETNEAIRLQKMAIALDQLEKPENQARISPVPTGLLAWAKIFAESAKTSELVEFFHMSIKGLEEVNPATGLDDMGSPNPYTDLDKARVRLQKMASLSGLMAIAAFVQDSKINEIIDSQIRSNGRFADASLALLAMRAAFIRDTLLMESLSIKSDSAKVLSNSGMMEEALKFLRQLDFVSKLSFHDDVYVLIEEKQYGLIQFEERMDLAGQKKTLKVWELALKKALAGITSFKKSSLTDNEQTNEALYRAEVAKQSRAANEMQRNIEAWKNKLR